MAITNDRQRAGDNTESVFTLAVSDTNEHDFPDTDGDDSSGGDPFSMELGGDVAAKVYNPQDQDATVRLEATHYEDPGFNHAETIKSGVTVTANGGVETLKGDSAAAFDWYRVVVSFSTAPTGSVATEVVFQTNDSGNL